MQIQHSYRCISGTEVFDTDDYPGATKEAAIQALMRDFEGSVTPLISIEGRPLSAYETSAPL